MIFAITASVASLVVGQPDVVVADFEGTDYGKWVVTGEAFGAGPARGTLAGQMAVTGFEGKGLVNSYLGGDAKVGTLTSPEFEISRKAMTFLIGGGGLEGKTCMNLLVEGKTVRTATGPNVNPGGSEALERVAWDVAEFAGKKGRIEIVDLATGGWGHINVDQIVLTDSPPPAIAIGATRAIKVERQYLNLPVSNDAPVRRVAVLAGGKTVREFEIRLSEKTPDFWAFLDLVAFKGQEIVVRADRLPAGGAALGVIEQADEIRAAGAPLYEESLRPQYHFSSRRGWLNDPNGLVYSAGEYHLYYQHNPYGWEWGNMHWGHAVSTDMVHWKELPVAVYPHAFGDWAYSGSAVVDAANTGGFKSGAEDVIVAAYTSTARGECIVYSNDRGRTFTEFAGNPVVKHEGRDPRLLWHEPTKSWVMAVYDEKPGEKVERDRQGISFYTSADLKAWKFRSRIGGFYECPDLFELPVDAGKGGTKWVLTAANSEYVVGAFDGATFTPESGKLPGNRSDRFYAAQTFSGTPDGRRIQIGWGRIDAPGMPFNQMMSFPCELSLRTTAEGIRLCSWPVKEIELLYGKEWVQKDAVAAPETPVRFDVERELLDIRATIEVQTASSVTLMVRGMAVRYDMAGKVLTCDGRSAPLTVRDGKISLRVLADRTSLEVFAADGAISMLTAAKVGPRGIEVVSEGGTARVVELRAAELWP